MGRLTEIVNEDKGKSASELRGFVEGLAARNDLTVGLLEFDREVVERDDEHERVVRTIKGPSITVVDRLEESRTYVAVYEPTKQRYLVRLGSRGGVLYDDGDSQTQYDHFALERISSLDGITKGYQSVDIPEHLITARLRVTHEVDYRSGGDHDYIDSCKGKLVVEGNMDPLFERVCAYVRGTENNGL